MRTMRLSRTMILIEQPTEHPVQIDLISSKSLSCAWYALVLSINAPVGQTCTQLPHLIQVLSPSGTSLSATIMLFAPRSATDNVKLPAISAQARTQRRHKMQRLLSSTKYGCDVSTTKLFQPGWIGQDVISS